jgi:hypothetical protein
VFQQWRWTEIAVTLGLAFVASLRKGWPMTFIAVRCPSCQSDQIVKRGKTARGTQRYVCQNTLWTGGVNMAITTFETLPALGSGGLYYTILAIPPRIVHPGKPQLAPYHLYSVIIGGKSAHERLSQ